MTYLDKVNYPEDLKKLNIDQMQILAKEIRRFLIKAVSKNGGHLSSNLGVVELTMALHYVYNCPTDKIVFDVGHQSYVHKILTGRKNDFGTLRQFKGLSGFPKVAESVYDSFDTGHSSTSIAVASGFCTARDLKQENHEVIAVIGDGSMTGGMAFEAMNNLGRAKTKMILVLNDNDMSISENVGALSKMLSQMRISKPYTSLKKTMLSVLDDSNKAEVIIKNALSKTKNTVKNIVVKGQVFEQLGFTYIGPIDGHNLHDLINAFEKSKNTNTPVLIHVHTEKGLGYKPAELNPSKFHGISPFNIKTGEILGTSKKSYSSVVGDVYLEQAKKNQNLVFISAAMITGTGLSPVYEKFKNRTFDVGICEPYAVTFSAALAKEGMIPVFCVYSTFLQRAYDQIVHDVCILSLHVIFMIDRAGIVGEDGETHQGVFDISFLSHIPNMTIIAPKSGLELEQMIQFAVDFDGPIAIRYPRGEAFLMENENKKEIVLGESETIYDGSDILIVSVGNMITIALELYEKLKEDGINATLINARFIKPIDKKIAENSSKYKKIVTIEDNVLKGGFAMNLLPMLYENGYKGEFYPFGYKDEFIEHGKVSELRELHGVTTDNIYNTIK